ncbi:hypothetical protein AA19596_2325 [Acetobacter fabarum DSM 19596]|nr:hypothetical protein AA19596_2325 [Acetobacter fabarum DSM 19596]
MTLSATKITGSSPVLRRQDNKPDRQSNVNWIKLESCNSLNFTLTPIKNGIPEILVELNVY